jgi:hypothetical protein
MSKIQVTLDATKLRNLVTNRSYTNRDGQQVDLQEVKFELIAVKEPKTIHTTDKYRIDKTHFASVIQSKDEREAKAPTIYIGEGFTTIWSAEDVVVHQAEIVSNSTSKDDLPF